MTSKNKILSVVAVLIVIGGVYVFSNNQDMNTDVPVDVITLTSEDGFQFDFPATWQANRAGVDQGSYRVLAQIFNPAQDPTQALENGDSIEQFVVSYSTDTCDVSGSVGTFAGQRAYMTDWAAGGGFDGTLLFRSVCIPLDEGSMTLKAEAQYGSQELMDNMFASFAFTGA